MGAEGGGGGGKGSQGHGIDGRRGRGEEDEKTGGWEVREKRRRKVHGGGKKRVKEKERRQTGRTRGWGTGSTCLWPARCSKTRWRGDGEAMAAEKPSCSLGYLPIKAGTLLFTQDDKATANPTDSERDTT